MKTLALDPAKLTGFAHSDGPSGVWDLGSEKYRLHRLFSNIREFHAKRPFECLASEDAPKGSNNSIVMSQHAELRGIIKLASQELNVECVFVHPTSLKAWAAHSGRAKKPDMMRWAKIHYGREFTDDNECDAFLIMQYVLAGQHLRAMPAKVVRKREKVRRKKESRLF